MANKWLEDRGDAPPRMDVPERLPAPRCDVCDEEIRDLPMGMIGWNRRSFDGFHFFHKGACDPGQTVWPSTHELITILASPRDFATFLLYMFQAVERSGELNRNAWRSTARAVGWLSAFAISSLDQSDFEVDLTTITVDDDLSGVTRYSWEQLIGIDDEDVE